MVTVKFVTSPEPRHRTKTRTPMAKKSKTSFAHTSHSLWLWLGLALLVLLADQFTKILIIGSYQLGDSSPVTSFFNMVRVHNSGAAFSFLAQAGGWQRWFF